MQDEPLPMMAGTVLLREASQHAMTLRPANKLAEALCHIAGTRTMTYTTIAHAKAMGFTVYTTGESLRQL